MANGLADDVLREIARIHPFFIDWFGGRIPQTEANYAAFSGVMGAEFWQVNPLGRYRPRDVILSEVWKNWNMQPGDPDYRIWIERAFVRNVIGDVAVAVYEEWQTYKGVTSGRTCTAVLQRRAGAPCGVEWLQMHESTFPPGTLP